MTTAVVSRVNAYVLTEDSTFNQGAVQNDPALEPPYVTGTNPYLDLTTTGRLTLRNLGYPIPMMLTVMDETGAAVTSFFDTLDPEYVLGDMKLNQLTLTRGSNRIVERVVVAIMTNNLSTVTLLPPRP